MIISDKINAHCLCSEEYIFGCNIPLKLMLYFWLYYAFKYDQSLRTHFGQEAGLTDSLLNCCL